jgi:hypothetical protein
MAPESGLWWRFSGEFYASELRIDDLQKVGGVINRF